MNTCSKASTASPLAMASALRGLLGSNSKLDMILLKLLDYTPNIQHETQKEEVQGKLAGLGHYIRAEKS